MTLMLYPKSHHHTQGHLGILLCYHLGGFIILCFTFRSMIHFEIITMKDVRSVSKSVVSMSISNCSSTICWKDYICFIVLPSLLCQKSVDYIYVDLFLNSLFCSIDLSVLSPIPHCLDCCSFIMSRSHVLSILWLFSSPSILSWLYWVFCLSI